jgi:hypothetical protein
MDAGALTAALKQLTDANAAGKTDVSDVNVRVRGRVRGSERACEKTGKETERWC